MNEHFVSIKVDREERPDLDQIYMDAVQMMTGRGGWPMSVFLTPECEPFFGGTYWPPRARDGMPGFDQVLQAVADAWQHRRQDLLEQADGSRELLRVRRRSVADAAGASRTACPPAIRRSSDDTLMQRSRSGAAAIVRSAARRLRTGAEVSPAAWPCAGCCGAGDARATTNCWTWSPPRSTTWPPAACFDHLGGGFHRYSVDARWLVPHFEKMLYDNALLAVCYLEAWQATGDEEYAAVVRQTLDYVLRDMTDPQGGFYSSEDADSEGEEGKFYLWTPGEIEAVLGGAEAARVFCRVYDVTEAGNFEGRNILNLSRPLEIEAKMLGREPTELAAELADARQRLLAARAKRVRPGRDEKVLVSWNSLAIDALARAGAALDEPRYTAAANAAADFLLTHLRRDDGRLLHYWRDGQAKYDAYLDDYAGLAMPC